MLPCIGTGIWNLSEEDQFYVECGFSISHEKKTEFCIHAVGDY